MAIERITGIVTDIVKHNDRHNIVSLFTRERGRVSFLVPSGGGKGGRMRNARIQPMAVLESDVNFTQGRELHSLRQISLREVWKDLYFNPVKSAIILFLSEFLNRYLRDAAPEPLMWDYVLQSLRLLDRRKGRCGNFHLAFLIGFLRLAGISPDITDYETGDYFDMQGGRAVAERPPHRNFLYPSEASLLPRILRMNFANDRLFRFKAGERRELLGKLLAYYSVHFPGMANLRSPEILSEIFS